MEVNSPRKCSFQSNSRQIPVSAPEGAHADTRNPPKTTKKRKVIKKCLSSKCHGMQTRNSKVSKARTDQAVEIGPGRDTPSNLTYQNSDLNSKEVWNLEDKVAKVLEKGLTLSLNFNGKKEELLDIIAKRDEVNDNRFWDLGRRLVLN
ncbi:hypothetical protein Ddye_024069 [Dipteronia dyeriana]|uniref:Uncharacterized protein n=1 Tax=Dipteronia dyeriana TaxID=168575 RepID=A0AAD9TUR9_9ROSI|nr:hypothetical protein Ddye_024069 [Dipteronia dyeriana]